MVINIKQALENFCFHFYTSLRKYTYDPDKTNMRVPQKLEKKLSTLHPTKELCM